jgi:hypothetical protein
MLKQGIVFHNKIRIEMEGMKKIIETLEAKSNDLKGQAGKLDEAIECLRNVCPHAQLESDGHDSHYKYSKCTECGKQFKS